MKVAINTCHGGFDLSDAAFEKLLERKGVEFDKKTDDRISGFTHYYQKGRLGDDDAYINHYDFYGEEHRADPDLIAVIEEMGKQADGYFAELKVVEIPDDVEWEIYEYDGDEWVAEKHRTWG